MVFWGSLSAHSKLVHFFLCFMQSWLLLYFEKRKNLLWMWICYVYIKATIKNELVASKSYNSVVGIRNLIVGGFCRTFQKQVYTPASCQKPKIRFIFLPSLETRSLVFFSEFVGENAYNLIENQDDKYHISRNNLSFHSK